MSLLTKALRCVAKAAETPYLVAQPLPAPFMIRPIPDAPVVAGFNYTGAEKLRNGVDSHEAIDLAAKRGTPVQAAADGYITASFEEWPVFVDGQRHRVDGQPLWFGPGLFVQIWHGQGRYTQYCHLDRLANLEWFSQPTAVDRHGEPSWQRHRVITAPVSQYRQAPFVRQGAVIGYAGMTGCGLGRPTFDDWIRGRDYVGVERDHLHMVTFGHRAPRSRRARRWDPFGLYGTAEQYPGPTLNWSDHQAGQRHHSLWLS